MTYDVDDTIAAIATAAGGAARGMVRVSGPATLAVVDHCFEKGARTLFSGKEESPDPFLAVASTGAVVLTLDDGGDTARRIPCELFHWPTSRSYTRQPVAEFHTLGSPPLLQALLAKVCRAGARLAEPGEFTLRAFLAGRLDLTQAEAVLGVIDSQQEDQLRVAAEQLAGNLAKPLHGLRDELLELLAELEAGLDFVEEDIEFIASSELIARLRAATGDVRSLADQMTSRQASATLCQIVLVGPPNAGKSSLFNALVERFGSPASAAEVPAIVSAERGTTRDYLTATIELSGLKCELVDTAGVDTRGADRSTIAAAAESQSIERRKQAQLRVVCQEATDMRVGAGSFDEADLVVLTKVDLTSASTIRARGEHPLMVATSSVTGEGLEDFGRVVAGLLAAGAVASRHECVAATADRCRDSLRLAEKALARATEETEAVAGDELVAADIRVALAELGKVAGTVTTDDLLDRVFSRFCIGK